MSAVRLEIAIVKHRGAAGRCHFAQLFMGREAHSLLYRAGGAGGKRTLQEPREERS